MQSEEKMPTVAENVLSRMTEKFPELGLIKESPGRVWLEFDCSKVREFFQFVRETWPDVHLSTITGLETSEAIEVIYHFVVDKVLVNVKVKTGPEAPSLDTIYDILPVADAYERELHDVLGIEFKGRESTPPLVLPDTWPQGYYPLRKNPNPKGGDENV